MRSLDALNAESGGGEPITVDRFLGRLEVKSGSILLGDPQDVAGGVEIANISVDQIEISASLWKYPLGRESVIALRLELGKPTRDGVRRKVGEVGIDTATLVIVDKVDFKENWAEVGNDRIGFISTRRDDAVLQILTTEFRLKTTRDNQFTARIADPVSNELEEEIIAYLKTKPEYADYPFLHFCVHTNNTFDRTMEMKGAWEFMPVGNEPTPLMFVSGTGRGDGVYDVEVDFEGDIPRVVTINFLDE